MPNEIREFIKNISENAHKARIEEKRAEAIKSSLSKKTDEIEGSQRDTGYIPMPDNIRKMLNGI